MIPHNKPQISESEIQRVAKALSNLELTLGNQVKEFEKSFSEYLKLYSAATSSGTSALHLALEVLKIGRQDEVILPAYTCATVALPVIYTGAKPVLADVGRDYNLSLGTLKKNVTEKTKAVIVPHMFGYAADVKLIKEFCEEKEIFLIEDCAQSLGAEYNGRKVGTFGDISIFSFYATKMITSIQGGIVCSKNKRWIEEVKELREPEGDPNDDRIKYRYSMSDINAAVGIEQLKKLNKFIKRRREIAAIYSEELENTNLILPQENQGRKHVFHRFVIRTNWNPEKVIKKLYSKGITATRMHYPPLHRRKLLKRFGILGEYPVTDELAETSVSLPIYPSLSDDEVLYITDSVKEILRDL